MNIFKKNKGIVLVNVLAMLLVAAVLGATVLTLSATTLVSSTNDKNSMQAYYTARSALDACVAGINNGAANSVLNKLLDETNRVAYVESEKTEVSGMGSYQIRMNFTDVDLTNLKITSTAECNGQTYKLSAYIKREISVVPVSTTITATATPMPTATATPTPSDTTTNTTVTPQGVVNFFDYLIFCTNSMNLSNTTVNFKNGNISAQGDVSLANGTNVSNNIKALGKVTGSSGLTVGGDIISNGDISLAGGTSVGGNIETQGKLTASGGISVNGNIEAIKDITISGGTSSVGQYVKTNGNLSLSGGSTLNAPRVQVLGNADISSTINGDLYVKGDCILSNCQINGDVYVEGKLTTTATISGNVYVNGNVYRNGGIFTKNLYTGGSYYIPYGMKVNGSLYYVSDLYFSNSTSCPSWFSPSLSPKSWAGGELLNVTSSELLSRMPEDLKNVGITEQIFAQVVPTVTTPTWDEPTKEQLPDMYVTKFVGDSKSKKASISNNCTLEFNSNTAYSTTFEFDTSVQDLYIRFSGNANGSKKYVNLPGGSELLNAGKNKLFIYLEPGVELVGTSNGYVGDQKTPNKPNVFIIGGQNSHINFGSSNNSLYAHVFMPLGKVSLGGDSKGSNFEKFYGSMVTSSPSFASNVKLSYVQPDLTGITINNSQVIIGETAPTTSTPTTPTPTTPTPATSAPATPAPTTVTSTQVITTGWTVLSYKKE